MNGLNNYALIDVARRHNDEVLANAQLNREVRAAMARNGYVGPTKLARRAFGAAVINIGKWIHGDQQVVTEAGLESGGTFGLAR